MWLKVRRQIQQVRIPFGHLSREERRCLMNRAIVLTVIKLARCGLITPATIKG
ncbi:hypothetical protein Y791_004420 [Salmonella enterica]|nr:hypothetical protein [Salmonella enterica]